MRAPKPGDVCRDSRGRELRVEAVDPHNRQDRHVQGKLITKPGAAPVAFATSTRIFEGTWHYV